jgi:hypothetical protein
MTNRLFLIALAVISIGVSTSAEHWPQWRGPLLNGISGEKGLPVRWSTTENIAWKLAVPERSGATPIVWGEHVFSMSGRAVIWRCGRSIGRAARFAGSGRSAAAIAA